MIAMRKTQVFGYSGYGSTSKDIRRAYEESRATWSLRERAQQKSDPPAARMEHADRPAVHPRRNGKRKMEGQRGGQTGRCRERKVPVSLLEEGAGMCMSNSLRRTHIGLDLVILGIILGALVWAFLL
jgi:hypothetical protein